MPKHSAKTLFHLNEIDRIAEALYNVSVRFQEPKWTDASLGTRERFRKLARTAIEEIYELNNYDLLADSGAGHSKHTPHVGV